MIIRKIIPIFLVFLAIIFAIFFTYSFFNSQNLKVNYKNVDKIYIYKSIDFENKSSKPLKTLSKTGQTVRLKKGDYYVAWKGSSGFTDGNKKVSLSNKKEVLDINPGWSEKKLNDLVDAQLIDINSAINARFPDTISLYIINKGTMYRNGEWYATTLQYNGPDRYSADTLKVILKNDNGTWKVITNVPDLAFNKSDYGQIPSDVLDDVNQYLYAPIQDKYLSE